MKSSLEKAEKQVARNYSPFPPVIVVFLTMAIIQGFYLKNSWDTRRQIQRARAEVQQVLPQAQTINDTVEKLGRDLFALSDQKTNEAAKIIAEFDIRLNAPPAAPAR